MTPEDVDHAFNQSSLAARIRSGVPQGQAKRQHFTPQLILRRFLSDGSTRLRQLDVKTGQPQAVSVAMAASRRRFYTLRDAETGGRDESIEGLLSVIEDAAAHALEKLTRSPASTTADDRVTLAYFSAAQLVRTPAALKRIQEVARVVNVVEMARLVTDDATFADAYATVREDEADGDSTWLQHWMREALLDDRIRVSNERELSLSMMVDILDDLAIHFFTMPWSLLSSTGGAFVTSDSGVGVLDRARDSQQVSVLGSLDARLLLPVSRGHCLQIGPVGDPALHVMSNDLTTDDTTRVNIAVYQWAERHLFADSQKTATDVRGAAKRMPHVAIAPRLFAQHVLIERDPDDDTLADANRRVGRAPYVEHGGQLFDYIVLYDDKDLARQALRALGISKVRAIRRTGGAIGRSGSQVLSPLEVRRVKGVPSR